MSSFSFLRDNSAKATWGFCTKYKIGNPRLFRASTSREFYFSGFQNLFGTKMIWSMTLQTTKRSNLLYPVEFVNHLHKLYLLPRMKSAIQDRCWPDRLRSRTGGSRPIIHKKIGIGPTEQTLATLGQTQQTFANIGMTEQTLSRPLARPNRP